MILSSNGETNTIRSLYHKDLYQQKWPKTTFIGRGSQGNHSGHKRLFVKALICEKIHANTLQLMYWFHRCLQVQTRRAWYKEHVMHGFHHPQKNEIVVKNLGLYLGN
jgi:hypothetical protein